MVSENEALGKTNRLHHSAAFSKKCVYIALSLLCIQFYTGCAFVRAVFEGGMAYMENPSMELVLDRLNTAASVSMTAKAVLNDIPISKDSTWPEEMESFPSGQLGEITRVLSLDGAYRENGGAISPIKAHLVQVQTILYDVPPDLYAKHGACYEEGEETLINGYYYKILGKGQFIKKSSPSNDELDSALDNAIKQFLSFGAPECSHRTFYKRKGKYKDALVNTIALENGHKNITEAIIAVLEGYSARDISDLKSALNEIKSVKIDIRQINDLSMSLENKKSLLKNNESVPGYESVNQVDNELSIKQNELSEKKERLTELQQIVDKSFENIQNDLPIVSEKDLVMLEKISAACKAVNGLLIDSVTLTGIALLKTPSSLMGIKDELKRMNDQKSRNPFIPIRIARLKANTGNVIGNIKTIVYVLKNERRMVGLIKSTADQIIKVTNKSKDSQGELPETSPKVDAVDESTVLADTETTEAQPVPIETQDVEIQETAEISSSEEIAIETPAKNVDISPTIEDTTEEISTEEPQIETPEIVSAFAKTESVSGQKDTDSSTTPQDEIVTKEQTELPQQIIKNIVSDWSRAWSSQNVAVYLECYAADFKPASGKSRKQWERIRIKRLHKQGINVALSDIVIILINDQKARVTFTQHYQSRNYSDCVLKELLFKLEDEKWKISKETQLMVYPDNKCSK